MKPLVTPPTPLDKKIAREYVKANWGGIAATAWEFYVEHGRGLVIDNADRQKPNKTDVMFEKLRYLTNVSSASLLRQYDMDVQGMLNTYDPETSVVVLITREYNEMDRIAASLLGNPPDDDPNPPPVITVDIYTFVPSPPICFAERAN